MGPVTYFRLCLLGCLIFNPSLEASPQSERSLHAGSGLNTTACRPGWNHYGEYCYRFYPQMVTWPAAEVQCQHHQPGAHLASILSETERDVVAQYLSMSTNMDFVWIGLHDPNKDKVWVWTDGSVFHYDAWNVGEPNNDRSKQYCVELWASTGYKKWNDNPCDKKKPYICKYRY